MYSVAKIEMMSGKSIEIELYHDKAPNTVNNFIDLANKGYYDNLIFHRVIKGFMIQGGCPDGNGMGGPGYGIKGEFSSNGFNTNDVVHNKGVISMARSNQPNSAGSQFFICHEAAPHLDGSYAAFGAVISGIDVVDEIAETNTDMRDLPMEPQVITSITIDLKGNEFEAPITL